MVPSATCLLCLSEGKVLIRQPDPIAQRGHMVHLEEGAIKDVETNGKWEKIQGGLARDISQQINLIALFDKGTGFLSPEMWSV